MRAAYDRSADDLGNIVALEHVNLQVPDQLLATQFYVSGLGLTRDPFMMTGTDNMWVNVGRSQFHLPTGRAQRLRGEVGLVVPDLDALQARLERLRAPLAATAFGFAAAEGFVEARCPWGNRIVCHAPAPEHGRVTLGMPRVVLDVPPGTAQGIAAFYREVIGAPASAGHEGGAACARVPAGPDQWLVFRETDAPVADYDGHHIQVYVANFSGPHRRLLERGLVSEESNQHQYRFKDIVDPASGTLLTTLEHEVRSMRHPMYARPLVNRNPAQTNRNYAMGHDAWIPGQGFEALDDPRMEMRQREAAQAQRAAPPPTR